MVRTSTVVTKRLRRRTNLLPLALHFSLTRTSVLRAVLAARRGGARSGPRIV
ncbi:uncharacterized protein DS421_11g330600 [Arachis hypogaea]|nr:uncharacterized protein DS421_11g330600 [Arachis hypogaea]